jgi:osmotically-inducible protein OsmY
MLFAKLTIIPSKQVFKWFLKLSTILLILTISQVLAAETGAIRDVDITHAVDRQLEVDEVVAANMIDVSTQGGIVTLSGSVGNLLVRERSAEIAAMIKGVRSIINRIKVRPVARSDAQVRSDIYQALQDDPATETFEIEANVQKGTVFLSGRVDSWQEEKLVVLVAKEVVGVKDVKSNIEVSPKTKRPDDEIRAEILSLLAYDVWIGDAPINVKIHNGHVFLSGTVGSLTAKVRAFENCWIAGVEAVDDRDLLIDWSRSDDMQRHNLWGIKTREEIKQAIEDTFKLDPRISKFDLGIFVDKGVVTLTGKVDNLKAKRVAEQDARNTRGVWLVENRIKVRPLWRSNFGPMHEVDAGIARKIRIALLRNPALHQHEISVSVQNHIARLSGSVFSSFEKSLADDIVSRVKGVTEVSNDLRVNHSWVEKEDWQIQRDVENELWWSPFVDEKDITIIVDNGVVNLSGAVNTLRQRRIATKKAYEGGAKNVRNHLRVRYGPEALRP